MKKTFFILIYLLIGTFLWAQEEEQGISAPKIIPPSPEATSLTQYSEIPVSKYTGVPNINIPLYTIKSRDVEVPISVSYHASGIKVTQEASTVGLGWALNAGGVISRTIMNQDDFRYTGPAANYFDPTIPDLEEVPNNYRYIGCHIGNDLDLRDYILQSGSDKDFEPDLFRYNFNGYTGKFIMQRDRTVALAKREKLKIEVFGDHADHWEITTPDGFLYEFAEYETHRSKATLQDQRTAWYLTKIISPRGEEVTFHYITDNNHTTTIGALSDREEYTPGNCPPIAEGIQPPVPQEYENVNLDHIDWDQGRVKFVYNNLGSDPRLDLRGGRKLNRMEIFQKSEDGSVENSPMKIYHFNYDYFIGTGDQDFQYDVTVQQSHLTHRLKLESIQEEGENGEQIPPYVFEYDEDNAPLAFPSKASAARDFWGYFNGKIGNDRLVPEYYGPAPYFEGSYVGIAGADRDPDPRFATEWSLNKIKYPTGGAAEFKFEAHDFDFDKSIIRDNSEFRSIPETEEVSTKLIYDTPDLQGTVFQDTLDITGGVTHNNIHAPGFVRVDLDAFFRPSQFGKPVDGLTGDNVYFELYNQFGRRVSRVALQGEVSCDEDGCEYTNSYSLYPGIYIWKAYVGDAIGADDSNGDGIVNTVEDMHATYRWDQVIGTEIDEGPGNEVSDGIIKKYAYAGGLRISEIIEHDGRDHSNDRVRKFKYNKIEDSNGDGILEEYSYGRRMARPIFASFKYREVDNDGQWNPLSADGSSEYEGCFVMVLSSNDYAVDNGSGNVVAYDKVEVLYGKDDTDNYGINGKSVFEYENKPDRILNYYMERPSGIPNLASTRNGLLLKQTDFKYVNDDFVKVKEVENTYSPKNVSRTDNKYGIRVVYLQVPIGSQDGIECSSVRTFIYPIPYDDWPRLKKTTERFYNQLDQTKFTEFVTDYEYDILESGHYQVSKITKTESDNTTTITENFYPLDYPDIDAYHDLRESYQHNTVIETVTSKDGQVIGGTFKDYVKQTNGAVVPEEVRILEASTPITDFNKSYTSGTPDNRYELRQVLSYSEHSNLQVVQKKGGMKTIYVWGYNSTYPVAKIENADFDDVKAALGGDTGLEALQSLDGEALINSLAVLRSDASLSEALVTTYTYKVGYGINTVTNENGQTTTFEYDDLGRLRVVRDHKGSILEHNEYQYKTNP